MFSTWLLSYIVELCRIDFLKKVLTLYRHSSIILYEVIKMTNPNKTTFYIKQDTVKLLDELAEAYGMSRSAWLSLKIQQEYDALHGNQKLKDTLFTLNEIQRLVQTIDVK